MTRTVLLPAGTALVGLAADAATKAWALAALGAGRQITVAGGLLRLRLVANHGAAFGIGAASEPLVAAASAIGIVLLGALGVAREQRRRAARCRPRRRRRPGQPGRPPVPRARRPARRRHRLDPRLVLRPHVQRGADVWLRGGILLAALAWLWNRRHARPR